MNSHRTICMISCLHPLCDDRIYWKECLSLKNNGFNVIHLAIDSKSSDYVSEEGIRLISIQKKRYAYNNYIDILIRRLTFRKSIYRLLLDQAAQLKADAYHLHDIQLNRIAKKLKNLPHQPKLIYDVHEPYPEIIEDLHHHTGLLRYVRRIMGKKVRRWQFKKSACHDQIICTEEHVANSFKGHFPNKRVSIIYNYCNLLNSDENAPKEIRYDAIYTGGISSFRGVWIILETALLAKNTGAKLKLLMLGHIKEAGLKVKIDSYIQKHDLNGYIEFIPSVPFQKVKDYYKISRCGLVIFENLGVYRRIWPIKTFEYLCFGLPILSSNFGHTHAVIKEHQCGACIDPDNPDKLLYQILSYKKDTEKHKLHSSRALNASNAYYKWEHIEKKFIELYNDLFETKEIDYLDSF